MDNESLQKILKRKPHIMLGRVIRPSEIMNAFMENHPELPPLEKANVKEQLNAAIILAASAHQGVVRKSGEPYINHPYAVACFLARMGMDRDCIIAGLLHDTVEDTTTTLDEISGLFGKKVEKLVDGVTKLTNLNIDKDEKQAIAFQKLITFAADDMRVIFIKLLDRLHNMMTLEAMSPERRQAISDETLRFYAPLAHRLGIYWLKEELEALSFYFLYTEEWTKIDEFIAEKYTDPDAVLVKLQDKVREAIVINCPKIVDHIGNIYGRTKSYHSIYNKTLKIDKAFSSLHDIIGIRVIIDSDDKNDCYLVMAAIHSHPEFMVMNGRFKDYISQPKANGYMSIHTVVRFREYFMEVQIRTAEMHRIAEEGNASHWAYKADLSHKDKTGQWLQQVLKDLTDASNAMNFMQDIETALPLEKITIFTPKGDMKTLPESSTLLDFAYSIHGDVGDRCIGGTVNGKKVPIYYRLSNKDEVEVETSKKQNPRADWLNFVVTHKAKQYIRRHISQQEKSYYIEKGKEKLKAIFDAAGKSADFNDIEKLDGYIKLSDRYSLHKENRLNNFFHKLAIGEIRFRKAISAFFSEEEIDKLIEKIPLKVAQFFPEKKKEPLIPETLPPASQHSIFVKGLGEVKDYIVARCCNPEEGDPIAAYTSQNRGYVLHNKACPSLQKLQKERIEKNVFWYTYNSYLIEFIIEIKNTPGALLEVIEEITATGLNISSLHIGSHDNSERSGFVYVTVKGSDLKSLSRLSNELKNKKSIISFNFNNITDV